MILYIIKSVIVLSLCLGIYLLLLEREKMHRFNRVFLILALLAGLYIPTINFDAPIPSPEIYNQLTETKSAINFELEKPGAQLNDSYNKGIKTVSSLFGTENSSGASVRYKTPFEYKLTGGLIIALYMSGFLVVSLNLVFGVYQMGRQLKAGKKIKVEGATLVLLEKDVVPHSFLKFIFLNKEAYEKGEISQEVIKHEQSHVSQLHTIDLLFLEFIHILFWFNPLIIFYKRAIKENHEFLADSAVVTDSKDISGYQNILLESASRSKPGYLSSTLNYRLTKKRLILMAKRSSRYTMFTKQFALLPVMMLFLFIFGAKERPGLYESPYKSVLGQEYVVYQFVSDEAYYSDIKLNVKAEPKSKFANLKRKHDDNGNLFSGEQNWYGRQNDKLYYVYAYEDGLEIEFRGYDLDGALRFKQERTYNEGKEVYSKTFVYQDGTEVLLLYSKRENGFVTSTTLYENGRINQEYTYQENDDNRLRTHIYHGYMTHYDEEGNIISQNLFDNGELIEKIK